MIYASPMIPSNKHSASLFFSSIINQQSSVENLSRRLRKKESILRERVVLLDDPFFSIVESELTSDEVPPHPCLPAGRLTLPLRGGRAGWRWTILCSFFCTIWVISLDRKLDRKSRSLAFPALRTDGPAVGFDHPLGPEETKPRPILFRRMEKFVDAFDGGLDPGPLV